MTNNINHILETSCYIRVELYNTYNQYLVYQQFNDKSIVYQGHGPLTFAPEPENIPKVMYEDEFLQWILHNNYEVKSL